MDLWQWSCVVMGVVMIAGIIALDWYIHHDQPPIVGPAVHLKPQRKPRNGIERDRFQLSRLAEKIKAAEAEWEKELNNNELPGDGTEE